ncbi:hypothetical protein MNBD_ALPHA06-282, partial [hydrothermal vent metagenome]
VNGQDELAAENAQNRLNLGVNYWITSTMVTKIGLEFRDFTTAGVDNETQYKFQVGYGF